MHSLRLHVYDHGVVNLCACLITSLFFLCNTERELKICWVKLNYRRGPARIWFSLKQQTKQTIQDQLLFQFMKCINFDSRVKYFVRVCSWFMDCNLLFENSELINCQVRSVKKVCCLYLAVAKDARIQTRNCLKVFSLPPSWNTNSYETWTFVRSVVKVVPRSGGCDLRLLTVGDVALQQHRNGD